MRMLGCCFLSVEYAHDCSFYFLGSIRKSRDYARILHVEIEESCSDQQDTLQKSLALVCRELVQVLRCTEHMSKLAEGQVRKEGTRSTKKPLEDSAIFHYEPEP